MNWKQPPTQPPVSSWTFIEELKAPLWTNHGWGRRQSRPGEIDVSGGVTVRREFPDPDDLLSTAYEDVDAFLRAGGIPNDRGYPRCFPPECIYPYRRVQ